MNKYSKKEYEVAYFVDRKIKILTNGKVIIRDYKNSIRKIKKGFELDEAKNSFRGRISSFNSDNKTLRKDNLSRTRNYIIDYVCMHESEWLSFITLTFKENITDISYANKKFHNCMTSISKNFKDFKYIGVPEFQKRGAIHYHILTNIKCDSELLSKQENCDSKYDLKYWPHGFTSAFDLTKTKDSFNVSLYLLKYLYKDLDNRLFGRTKILKSNNLLKPNIYELSKNNKKYNEALDYIQNKGYIFKIEEIEPNKPFSIPFTNIEFEKVVDEDIKKIKIILESEE